MFIGRSLKQRKQVFLIGLFKFLVLRCRYPVLCVLYVFYKDPCSTNIFSKLYLSKFILQRLMLFVFQKHDSNEDLAYWLSNSSTLLIMLQKSLKAAGSTGTSPQKRPQTQSSFLGRMVHLINYSWSWLTWSPLFSNACLSSWQESIL